MNLVRFDTAPIVRAGFPELGRRFLLWRTFPPRRVGGKPVKLPCSAAGTPIDGTDERRWLDFGSAAGLAARSGLGLGIALGWGLGGLDLDRCRVEGGTLSELARRLLRHFPTYCEVSPSRTGVKAYFLAGAAFTTTAKVDAKGIELYAGRRFFALTGRPAGAAVVRIADCTAAACTLADVLRPRRSMAYTGPAVPLPVSARDTLTTCGVVRERPSLLGGTVYTLRRCPFTGEAHPGGGPYALAFPDGGLYLRCDRSVHGQRAEMVRPPQGRR
jgi:hypothetical protein